MAVAQAARSRRSQPPYAATYVNKGFRSHHTTTPLENPKPNTQQKGTRPKYASRLTSIHQQATHNPQPTSYLRPASSGLNTRATCAHLERDNVNAGFSRTVKIHPAPQKAPTSSGIITAAVHTNRKTFATALPPHVVGALWQREGMDFSRIPLLRVACSVCVDIRSITSSSARIRTLLGRRELLLFFPDLLERLASSSNNAGGRDTASSAVKLQGPPSMAMLGVSWGPGTAVSMWSGDRSSGDQSSAVGAVRYAPPPVLACFRGNSGTPGWRSSNHAADIYFGFHGSTALVSTRPGCALPLQR